MNKRQIETFHPLSLSVRRLFHRLADWVSTLHHDSNISVGMRAVLESVIDGGPQTVPQMARVRPVTRQHVQGLVNALVAGGYVETVDNPAHKRSKLVSPTDRGLAAFRGMRALEDRALNRVRLNVSAEDLATAASVLEALIVAFASERRSLVD